MEKRSTAGLWAGRGSLGWLRARLLPGGAAALMIAAYGMLLAALATFALLQRDVGAGGFTLGILSLSAMFVLHVVLIDLEERLGSDRAMRQHLLANGLLWLLVAWISLDSKNFSFVPFLLFMLVAQAVVSLPPRGATLTTAALLGGWLGLLALHGFTPLEVLSNALALSTGLIFVVTFSYVLSLYRAQTARAEALLAELTAANAELEAARRRERELAVAEERVRIARDIHDGLGHHLTALSVQLQAAARLIERDPGRAAAAIATSREVTQAALDEVRQSVATMRRTPLDGRSLAEALEALTGDFGRRTGLAASFTVTGEAPELPPGAAQTLYRAAQEGLTNAQRHGAARTVRVTLAHTARGASLAVTDDGAGAGGTAGGGFGLAGLRERAEQLGGRFAASPLPEGGFQLVIDVPAVPREVKG